MEQNLEFMTQGDKLLAIKDDLYTMICARYAAFELDVSTGLLILDAIKADLQSMALNALMRRGDGIINSLAKERGTDNVVAEEQTNESGH